MPKTILWYLLLVVTSLGAQTPKVLVIGIDGCRSDVLETANTPNIDALIANGYYSPDALNDDITFSGPGWSAILTGVTSPKHGVTNNGFGGSNYAAYPDFLKRIKTFDPSLFTASIVHWNPINDQIIDNVTDLEVNVATDQEVENEAVDLLTNGNPDAAFLHFDDPDGAGHSGGFSADNPNYITQIEQVDSHVGAVMAALTGRPNYGNEDWLILLVPDHGGLGNSHGGNSIEEQRVFFIASGDGVANTVVTATELVNPPPANCLEETVELSFDGDNDRVSIAETPLFNFGASQDFTIECRVRTEIAADVAIITDKDWDSGNLPGFVFSFRFASGPEWKVNVGDGSNRADLNVSSIADGQWHTLSVTFDRDGMMRAYTDGLYVGQSSMAGVGNITTTGGLFFGADVDNEYDYSGALAEVRIWDGLLPATAIQDWHCKRLSSDHPEYSNLLGYWPLDENSGSTVNDLAGGNHHGTIVGANWETPGPIITYDYSNTPRLEDVAVTALEHLCIPIDPLWNLDGQSRVMSCAALPVSWQRISAVRQADASVEVSWSTVAETNNAGFVVERQDLNGRWVEVSNLMAPRISRSYAYQDKTAPRRATAYRIRQLDFDGAVDYSVMVIAPASKAGEFSKSFIIVPNPLETEINAIPETSFTVGTSWRLFGVDGRQIRTGKVEVGHQLRINANELEAGTYSLQIEGYVAQKCVIR